MGTNRKVKKICLVINNLLIPSEAMLTKNGQLHANTHRHTIQSAKMMPVKRKKERKSKKELKIREEEGELENMTVEKRFSAKLLYILFS